MRSKHGPNSWDDYLNVHQRRIATFADHFIVEDRVAFTRTASQVLPSVEPGESQIRARAYGVTMTSNSGDLTPTVDGYRTRVYGPVVDYSDIITIEPGKRGGKPVIRGLRVTVDDVLSYMAAGMSPEQIVADFPPLTLVDIRAVLAYAADRERRISTAG